MNEKKKLKDLRDRIKTMKEEDKQKESLSSYACANPILQKKEMWEKIKLKRKMKEVNEFKGSQYQIVSWYLR